MFQIAVRTNLVGFQDVFNCQIEICIYVIHRTLKIPARDKLAACLFINLVCLRFFFHKKYISLDLDGFIFFIFWDILHYVFH